MNLKSAWLLDPACVERRLASLPSFVYTAAVKKSHTGLRKLQLHKLWPFGFGFRERAARAKHDLQVPIHKLGPTCAVSALRSTQISVRRHGTIGTITQEPGGTLRKYFRLGSCIRELKGPGKTVLRSQRQNLESLTLKLN